MPRVVHFEISADDIERTVQFYQTVFGWEIKKWDGPVDYWMIMTGAPDQPGIDGGLMKRTEPGAYTVCTIDVPSVDEYTQKIVAGGGEILVEKMAIPGVGYMAYFKDPDGNVFSVMQEDRSAA
jgi:hypothetical protein